MAAVGTELGGGVWKTAAGGEGLQGAFPVLVLNSMLEKHVVGICLEATEGQDHTVGLYTQVSHTHASTPLTVIYEVMSCYK